MFLGVDIGTASSKAVVTDEHGDIVVSEVRTHATSSPHPGWFEHDAENVWWADFLDLVRRVLLRVDSNAVQCVGVSGIGPVVLLTDAAGRPVRPAILYGVDTRAEREIETLTARLGAERVLAVAGNRLTTQAVGPKMLWVAAHDPDAWARATRWHCASSYLVDRLTGEYVLDRYSASAADPLVDLGTLDWWDDAWEAVAPNLERPRLAWPGDVVGHLLPSAAEATGLRPGTPVLAGTIDALAEAYSVGCRDVGDTMVMYGSTLFFVQVVPRPASHPGLWAASGLTSRTYTLAAGMATSGLVTSWLAGVAGTDVGTLAAEAAMVRAGSDGLVLLPYFSGERTPLFDPGARGCWLGLTLAHTRAHLFRSALEGVGFGVRHNLEAMSEAGAAPRRLVAVGGGTRDDLWPQIVSDITGLPQDVPTTAIGASYGDARLAADACGVDTTGWNPVSHRLEPDPASTTVYAQLYDVYRRTYDALRDDMHLLTALASGPVG
jgi:xylulokinase